MPSAETGDVARKLKQEQLARIWAVVERMKRPSPSTIKLSDGKEIKLSYETLHCLKSGSFLSATTWDILCSFLTSKLSLKNQFLVGYDAQFPILEPNQVCFWISAFYNSSMVTNRSWCIASFLKSNAAINMYFLREPWFHRGAVYRRIADISKAVNVPAHELTVTINQVCVFLN